MRSEPGKPGLERSHRRALRMIISLLTAALCVGGVAISATPANADGNGTQLAIKTRGNGISDPPRNVQVCGFNRDLVWTCTEETWLLSGEYYKLFPGYYWKHFVIITVDFKAKIPYWVPSESGAEWYNFDITESVVKQLDNCREWYSGICADE